MSDQRVVGMMVNHSEIELTIQQMSDVIRDVAYRVAKEQYPPTHAKHSEYFDETGTLIVMDETSVKALLKDAVEHYLQFNAVSRSNGSTDFLYYLNDSFQLVANAIMQDAHKVSFLTAQFAHCCGMLAGNLAPVIDDLSRTGQGVEKVESFHVNTKESYYLVYGENVDNPETYDPEEDNLKNVVINDTPEELQRWEEKKKRLREEEDNQAFTDYVGMVGECLKESIEDGSFQNASSRWNLRPRVVYTGIRDVSSLPGPEVTPMSNPHFGPTPLNGDVSAIDAAIADLTGANIPDGIQLK